MPSFAVIPLSIFIFVVWRVLATLLHVNGLRVCDAHFVISMHFEYVLEVLMVSGPEPAFDDFDPALIFSALFPMLHCMFATALAGCVSVVSFLRVGQMLCFFRRGCRTRR